MNKIHSVIVFSMLIYGGSTVGFGKKTFFSTRSQGLDSVCELVGWQQQIYKYDQEQNYGTLAALLKYTRSFKQDKIAYFLFGNEILTFTGSRVAGRKDTDILADYFGLPNDFSSTVLVRPRITNAVMEFSWFQAFDNTVPGLYIMLFAPIIHTKWDLNMLEGIMQPGTASFPAGYMSNSVIARSALAPNVVTAFEGKTTFGDMQEPLEYGKIFGRQTRNRVAELQATVGWNYNREWYHAGIYARIGAPTGNASSAQFLFESIAGNCHHWDIGGGISGHVVGWSDKETGRKIALYGDIHISHLCTSHQKRSFDLTPNGPGSRYMLIEQVAAPSQALFFAGNPAVNQYNGKLVPAINRTTFNTRISMAAQADLVLKLTYQKDRFECDLGYNFWGRSKEKLHARDTLQANSFAIKGDAQIYGFNPANNDSPVAVNATQSKATINAGQGNGNSNFQNLNADNPVPASTTGGQILNQLTAADAAALGITRVQIDGSNQAVLLQDSNINQDSALLPRAISNKLFIHCNYIWNNRDDVDLYVGIGAASEIANTNPDHNSGFSQWLVWAKGGIAY